MNVKLSSKKAQQQSELLNENFRSSQLWIFRLCVKTGQTLARFLLRQHLWAVLIYVYGQF